jgi:class 3 adenylate cyclase/tetratricopeptide (TPR) repeat protein
MAQEAEPLVRKTVTVLFCDVTGFTSLGERVDPETMRRVMLRYFDEMRTVLERHGGTVEKFIGDAVMAVFGVPILHEDDALRAVRAAEEMQRSLKALNEELGARWGLQLDMRIGINTGEVVVGDPGTGQTIATGDTVNVAARLQQAAQPGDILLGRATHQLVRDQVSAGPLQAFSLKGKSERVATWRLKQVHERASGMLRRLEAPFVGRTYERQMLDELYARTVEEESCRLTVVVGAAGLGKTRLVAEFASKLLAPEVLHGRCLSYGEGITFWPVIEIIRDAAGIVSDDSAVDARAKISRLLPDGGDSGVVCERVCSTIGLTDQRTQAEESFWALRRLFESIARTRPLVLVFEDLHWAEPTLLDLVEYLVGWSAGSPILLVGTGRPELLEARPAWSADAILLEPLSDTETAELAENVLGGGTLDPEIGVRVSEAAEGNPLFAEEVVRMLKDDGELVELDGRWTTRGDVELRVPPSISALLAARLDRLDPAERIVLQCASVIGKEFWWGAVGELAPHDFRGQVAPQLHSLVRKRLIEPGGSSALVGEDSFRFSHILYRDAAYASLPKSARAELHERFASWSSRRIGARRTEIEEILGYHYEQAHEARAELGPVDERTRELGDRASTLLASAGRRALERGDLHAAAALLRRAVRLVGDDSASSDLTRDLGVALMESGKLREADALLGTVIAAAERAGDSGRAAHAAVVRGFARFRIDETAAADETRRVAVDAISTFTSLGDHVGLARAWRLLSVTHGWESQWHQMGEALRQALAHAREAGDASEEATILTWLNTALYYGPTRVAEAVRHCEAMLEGRDWNRVVEATSTCQLAGLLAMMGRFDEARDLTGRSIVTLAELGARIRLGHALIYAGEVEFLAGDARAAERELLNAYETLEASGDRGGALEAAYDLADVLCTQRRYAEAETWSARGRNVIEQSDVMMRVLGFEVDARIAAHDGRIDEAKQLARRAVELGQQTDALNLRARTLMTLSEVLAVDGRSDLASGAAQDAARLFDAKGNAVFAAQARALAESAATLA